MTVRKLAALAAAVGLWIPGASFAKDPKKDPAPPAAKSAAPTKSNQELAAAVAARLKASGVAKGARIHIETSDGVVELTGDVKSAAQKTQIIETVMSIPGVKEVDSMLREVPADPAVKRVSGEGPSTLPPLVGVPAKDGPVPPLAVVPGIPLAAPGTGGLPGGVYPPGGYGPGPGEPLPVAGPPVGPGAMAAYDSAGPNLPPYAWPTYAPYPNYSRVGYPQSYPYNAFPYIGPFYPYPKVPLGWRKVQLEWDDGHWYLGRLSTPHDYWRVRYW